MFGLSPEELALAVSAWATLAGGVVAVFVRVGRVLERIDGHERRIENLERAVAGRVLNAVVKR